jgi:TPR repeat protein
MFFSAVRRANEEESMKRVWMLALLSVVACSEKQGQGGATQDKAAAALAGKDEKCPGGTVKGCLDAATEADRRGDPARAVELYTRVCDAGVARACNVLGTLVWQGRGVSADPARAYSLYMRACDGGDAAGCFSAGICHRTGTCAEKNDAEATKLLQRACDAGDSRACANVGGH